MLSEVWLLLMFMRNKGFPGASVVKNPPANAGDTGSIPCAHIYEAMQGEPLEKGVAAHFSTLAWRIPWTEGPGGL